MKYHVPDMSCAHCKASIEKAVKALDQTASDSIDLSSKTLDITSEMAEDRLVAALRTIGFEASRLNA